MVMAFEVAGEPLAQTPVGVRTQVIISPVISVLVVYVELTAPEITEPFFFH